MISEQLHAARATLWRQKSNPLLTLDDAQSWLEQIGLCLFLPRKTQILAPAPSFVEACAGETNATPPRGAIETAMGLVSRLIESGAAVALNLLGAPTDHPDFIASAETLPFIYALRGDRDWKHAPASSGPARVSPLVAQVWKLLERRGVLTAAEIQSDLGRELTEGAVLRALHELWSMMRVMPLYQSGGHAAFWEPMQSRHSKAVKTGGSMSQVTALSVMASVYLQSVIAASSEDAEAFLSPLASRTKVREVVRGLAATRQLSMTSLESRTLLFVEGSLPEFPEVAAPPESAPAFAPPERTFAPRRRPTTAQRDAGFKAGNRERPGERPQREERPFVRRENRPDRPSRGTGGFESPRRTESPRGTTGSGFRSKRGKPTQSSFASSGSGKPFRKREEEPRGPGDGLRPDGTKKKERWRNLPGGRPDQKGKPKRFGPRREEIVGGERQSSGGFRPSAKRPERPIGAGGERRPRPFQGRSEERRGAGAPGKPFNRPRREGSGSERSSSKYRGDANRPSRAVRTDSGPGQGAQSREDFRPRPEGAVGGAGKPFQKPGGPPAGRRFPGKPFAGRPGAGKQGGPRTSSGAKPGQPGRFKPRPGQGPKFGAKRGNRPPGPFRKRPE